MPDALRRFFDDVIAALARLVSEVIEPSPQPAAIEPEPQIAAAGPNADLPDSQTLIARFAAMRSSGGTFIGTSVPATAAAPRAVVPVAPSAPGNTIAGVLSDSQRSLGAPSAVDQAQAPSADVLSSIETADPSVAAMQSEAVQPPGMQSPAAQPAIPTPQVVADNAQPAATTQAAAVTSSPASTALPAVAQSSPSQFVAADPGQTPAMLDRDRLGALGLATPPPGLPDSARTLAASPVHGGTVDAAAAHEFVAARGDEPASLARPDAGSLALSPARSGQLEVGEARALHFDSQRGEALTATWGALMRSPVIGAPAPSPSAQPDGSHAAPAPKAAPALDVTDTAPPAWPELPEWPLASDDAAVAQRAPLSAGAERGWYV